MRPEQKLGFLAAVIERVGRRVGEPARQFFVRRPYPTAVNIHFVKRSTHPDAQPA